MLKGTICAKNLNSIAPGGVNDRIGCNSRLWIGKDVIHGELRIGHAQTHGGIALGLDRLVAILGGSETIRDYIAFPKNNSGRDVMINAPSALEDAQLEELYLKTLPKTLL